MNKQSSMVVLISGNGSNLQALIDFQSHPDCQYRIRKVISNRPNAYGLQRANNHGIATEVIDHTLYQERADFERALIKSIEPDHTDQLILAGFMRILTPAFTETFTGKTLNIHPSLLPKYPGLHTHRRALEAGDSIHGLSIHFVTAELDGGPIILQASCPVESNDTEQSLQQKIHQLEHQAYPLTANLVATNQIQWQSGQVYWQNQPLAQPLQLADLLHG